MTEDSEQRTVKNKTKRLLGLRLEMTDVERKAHGSGREAQGKKKMRKECRTRQFLSNSLTHKGDFSIVFLLKESLSIDQSH
jgi:hypothetical protein